MAEMTLSAALASAEETWRDGHGTINEDVAQTLAAEVRRLQALVEFIAADALDVVDAAEAGEWEGGYRQAMVNVLCSINLEKDRAR
jgi:hypothetical protein